jgi:hypothetical protein
MLTRTIGAIATASSSAKRRSGLVSSVIAVDAWPSTVSLGQRLGCEGITLHGGSPVQIAIPA